MHAEHHLVFALGGGGGWSGLKASLDAHKIGHASYAMPLPCLRAVARAFMSRHTPGGEGHCLPLSSHMHVVGNHPQAGSECGGKAVKTSLGTAPKRWSTKKYGYLEWLDALMPTHEEPRHGTRRPGRAPISFRRLAIRFPFINDCTIMGSSVRNTGCGVHVCRGLFDHIC